MFNRPPPNVFKTFFTATKCVLRTTAADSFLRRIGEREYTLWTRRLLGDEFVWAQGLGSFRLSKLTGEV